ncbi:hypothetical protein RvY_00590 [Ramazzottius varieornatus]|uniref:ATPase AAA-type core domain-containing protein n=1 Tax=Ramazzottius varieornatus TaxID=947166 RepID=A0A1D1UJK6_RAMVA|nr:hypothetical protein RvY_00590 [Ramazzottius varieornatus]
MQLFRSQKILKPPRGVLMFGPSRNGKTLLAKACASQTHYNFINVSASALVSKWVSVPAILSCSFWRATLGTGRA